MKVGKNDVNDIREGKWVDYYHNFHCILVIIIREAGLVISINIQCILVKVSNQGRAFGKLETMMSMILRKENG